MFMYEENCLYPVVLHGVAIYHVQRANLYVVRAYGRYVRKLREESTGAYSAVRVFRFQGIMSVLAINSGHAKGKSMVNLVTCCGEK